MMKKILGLVLWLMTDSLMGQDDEAQRAGEYRDLQFNLFDNCLPLHPEVSAFNMSNPPHEIFTFTPTEEALRDLVYSGVVNQLRNANIFSAHIFPERPDLSKPMEDDPEEKPAALIRLLYIDLSFYGENSETIVNVYYRKPLHDPISGHSKMVTTWVTSQSVDSSSGVVEQVKLLTGKFILDYLSANRRPCALREIGP